MEDRRRAYITAAPAAHSSRGVIAVLRALVSSSERGACSVAAAGFFGLVKEEADLRNTGPKWQKKRLQMYLDMYLNMYLW